jgi:hypothetical protein
MINYNQIKNKPNVFLSFTGLTVEEFNELLLNFASAWNNYVYKNFIQGKDRIRNYGGGNIPVLNTVEDKLLFILFYYKIYPIQEVQGFFFGMSQESACDWIGRLSVCLTEALGYERVLPKRKKENWETIFVNFPTLEIFIDGSERPVNRPEKNQKEYYSGKKKHHTVKNVFVTDKTNYVHFLTETVSGKQHDKRILDEKCGHLPRDSIVWTDLGFEGIEKDNLLGSKIFMPKKNHVEESSQSMRSLIMQIYQGLE